MKNFDGLVQYGMNAVKSLFILNGGALLAFITFSGSLLAKSEHGALLAGISLAKALIPAFYCFTAGLCLSALISGVAYVNFSFGFAIHPDAPSAYNFIRSKEVPLAPARYYRWAQLSAWIAVALGLTSLSSFVIGCFFVAHALDTLGI